MLCMDKMLWTLLPSYMSQGVERQIWMVVNDNKNNYTTTTTTTTATTEMFQT